MKTTVDIADDLFFRAKECARARHTTLRELMETGLAHAIEKAEERPSRVEPVVFKGNGLTEAFRDAPWSAFRDAANEQPSP